MATRAKSAALALLSLFFLTAPLGAQEDVFPDGSPVPEWFHDSSRRSLQSLGKRYVITDYGVKRDSTLVQTEAIQAVIDLAAARGGVVVIPRGTFLSGALHFRQGSHLWVEGRLKGSDRVRDFPLTTTRIEGQTCTYFPALVNVESVDGFVLGGNGTIDGNGYVFWEEMKIRWQWNPQATNKDGQRPRLVHIADSRHVTVQDVRLKDSPFWTCHSYRSHHLRFLGLTITSRTEGSVVGYSTDAIGLDHCYDVLVKDCFMGVSDDAVVLKGGKGTFADKAPENGPNERIIIEDCHFGRVHSCLTLGSESLQDRNVVLRRSHSDAAGAILHLKMRPDTPQHYEYVSVEDMTGAARTVLRVRPWTQYYHREERKDMPLSRCNDICLKRVQVESASPLDMELSSQYRLDKITWDGRDLLQGLTGSLVAQSTAAPGTPMWSREEQAAANRKAWGQVNYDTSAILPYTLENPLAFADGRKLRSRKEWPARRQEILSLFQKYMYGQLPPPSEIYTELLEEGLSLSGFATRRQVRMRFFPDGSGPKIDWLILTPNHVKGPVPTILLLNYNGNQELLPDKEILLTDAWLRTGTHKADESSRGLLSRENGQVTVFPLGMMLARGYAFVSACYSDISPDPDMLEHENGIILQDSFAYSGVFELWGTRDPSRQDNTSSLMAWAWGLMRGMDLIEKDPLLDASRVLLTGSSRLGKAALIAAAFDDRFPLVVPNQSGGGGVRLAKRNFGESVATEVSSYRHWYCRAYDRFADNTEAMPFDQHLLVSAVAPRGILVEGFNERWFDTYGEYLSLQAASPVWEFLGKHGLPEGDWPDNYDTSAIGPDVGYVRRTGGHGISAVDWQWMLDFADRYFQAMPVLSR